MDTDMIVKFFEDYGWIMTLLATSGIFFIGALKSFGLFDKLGAKVRKYVYFALSCAASIAACTAYLCATDGFAWKEWGVMIACIIPYTLAMYGLYENTGIRGLLRKVLFSPAKKLFARLETVFKKEGFSCGKVKDALQDFAEDVIQEAADAAADIMTEGQKTDGGGERGEAAEIGEADAEDEPEAEESETAENGAEKRAADIDGRDADAKDAENGTLHE